MNQDYKDRLTIAAGLIVQEAKKAKQVYPASFVNQHEGYAVILEEMDELWTEIKKNPKQYDLQAQQKEAIQIAAMCLRFIVELT